MILEGFLSRGGGERVVNSVRRAVFERFPKLFVKYDIRSVLIGETKMVSRSDVSTVAKKEIRDFSLNVRADVSFYQWLLVKSNSGGSIISLADSFINEVLGKESITLSLADIEYLKQQMRSFLGESVGDKLYEELRFRDMVSVKLSSGGKA